MIPPFSISGVLPPFVGPNPTDRAHCSPYLASMSELVSRFATTPERSTLLGGLLDYRDAMRAIGTVDGTQWIDGSFAEDVEATRGRAPADIDVVTMAPRPVADPARWRQLVISNRTLFEPSETKANYSCDAYFIDLTKRPDLVVADSIYFFGLFSHQRVTSLWKGMVALPLTSDDQTARAML